MSGSSSKEQSLVKPYTRERKNSISEINDNEDELLEYHRWQREERLREQEMEKLVSDHEENICCSGFDFLFRLYPVYARMEFVYVLNLQ